uniref:Ferritin n=1 Tax=Xiphophorus couchianus TaxID=32473 RepID=A0A3B5MGF8_9TELE
MLIHSSTLGCHQIQQAQMNSVRFDLNTFEVSMWVHTRKCSFNSFWRKPEKDEWGSGLEAMQCALQLEKNVNQALLDLHKLASDRVDPHLCDFLESHYLNEQVESIKKLGDHITNLTRMDAHNNKMAEYLFDKHTLGGQS